MNKQTKKVNNKNVKIEEVVEMVNVEETNVEVFNLNELTDAEREMIIELRMKESKSKESKVKSGLKKLKSKTTKFMEKKSNRYIAGGVAAVAVVGGIAVAATLGKDDEGDVIEGEFNELETDLNEETYETEVNETKELEILESMDNDDVEVTEET